MNFVTSLQSPDGGSRPTVIFVHGLRTSAALWSDQERALHAAGYPTRAIDLPGHGSRRGERFTMEGARAVLDEVVASLEPQSTYVLAGLSLGGYTVLNYAGRTCREHETLSMPMARGESPRPRRAQLVGVVAAACSSDPSTKPVRAYRDVTVALAKLAPFVRSRTRAMLAHHPCASSTCAPPPISDTDAGGEEPLPWAVVADALTALESVSSLDNLASITVPVTLINGQWDHLRVEERRHRAALAGISLVVIPGAKHDVSLEAPTQFNRALLEFLAGLPSATQTHSYTVAH